MRRLIVLAGLVLLCAACGSANPPPQRVLSRYETATGRNIVRDCGYSVPLPGKARRSLWLFCDTLITTQRGKEIGLPILGAGTAAEGSYRPGQVPSGLTEVARPVTDVPSSAETAPSGVSPSTKGAAAPQPFLPVPTDLTMPGTDLPCTGQDIYPARWVTGAAREPGSSGHVLISYADYCVSGRDVFTPEGAGLVDYDPASNTLGAPAEVFQAAAGQQLSQRQVLGSPIFRGGYLYLFSSCAPYQGCGNGGVFLARALAAPVWWQNGFTYQYWTARGWSADTAEAVSLLGRSAAPEVSVGDYSADGHGLVMIEGTSVNGGFSVWQAAAPEGAWRRIETGRVPCTAGKRDDSEDLCRALIGHPELSTSGRLLISFYNPGDAHVEVASYPW